MFNFFCNHRGDNYSFVVDKYFFKVQNQEHRIWLLPSNQKQPSTDIPKKTFLRISQNSQESTCAGVSFFNKVACLTPAILLKRVVFHWILRNFKSIFCIEHLQKNASVCFETKIKQSLKETHVKTQVDLELMFLT